MPKIICPKCGELSGGDVHVFNEGLRKQKFKLSPVLPTCKKCAAEVIVRNRCSSGRIVVINGTCGSGKSTVAEILAEKKFFAIDGDCVMQTVKHKFNVPSVDFQDQSIFDEVADEIDTLAVFGEDFVLSHILMPEDMGKYIEIFEARNLKYYFFLLKPTYQTAVERCAARTCHTSVTPQQWIRHFYDALVFDDSVEVVDNSDISPRQTADYILGRIA